MADPAEGGGGPSIMDRMNQGQMGAAGGGGGAGGGASETPGALIDTFLRMLGIKGGLNGHSTGGFDAIFGLGNAFSGLSIQGKSLFSSMLDTRGGILTSFFADLGFTFGGSIHGAGGDVQHAPIGEAPVDTSGGGGGGGDAQYASINTIPSAAFQDMGAIQNTAPQHVTDATPPVRGANKAKRVSQSEGEGASR